MSKTSCRGLKGKAYEKCMKKYVKSSKMMFPNFNQKSDTVAVTGRSNNISGLFMGGRNKTERDKIMLTPKTGQYTLYTLKKKKK